MKKFLHALGNLFKAKCPECKSTMEAVDEVYGSQVYECKGCSKKWI